MIVVLGAGLSGLSAARELELRGEDYLVLEATNRVGGRVQTQVTPEGYRLDQGFHVVSTGYAAIRASKSLMGQELNWFDSGALVERKDGQGLTPWFHPLRHPTRLFRGRSLPFSTVDYVRFAKLAGDVFRQGGTIAERGDHISTADLLQAKGFSKEALEGFFRPFFGGVFLEDALETDAELFRFYLRAFLLGRAFLPKGGVEGLARAWSEGLPENRVRFGCRVRQLESGAGSQGWRLLLEGGEEMKASSVICALPGRSAANLLGWPEPEFRRTTTLYYEGKEALYPERCLALSAGKSTRVRHFYPVTNVDPTAAPEGKHLASATVLREGGLSEARLFEEVQREMARLAPAAEGLEPLARVVVEDALPVQTPQVRTDWARRRAKLPETLALAGDLSGLACQQQAIVSGQEAAQRLVAGDR